MDSRREIRDFLATRRARLTPEQVGLPRSGRRRVPGLRREEVALLAGVSVDYYIRLERGAVGGVSTDVLDALARALRLDEAEHAHLFDLVRAAAPSGPSRGRGTAGPVAPTRVRPNVQRLLDALVDAPAYLRNGRLDVLGTNRLGRALFSPLHLSPVVADAPGGPVNHARFAFLDPRADDFFTDWHTVAADIVAVLRTEAGRSPRDRALTGLVGELSTRSEAFRTRWAAHDVRLHRTGTKRFRHPVVGDLTLTYEVLDLTADPGQALVVYGAEPGTPSADGLSLLATWTATPRQEDEGAQERPWS